MEQFKRALVIMLPTKGELILKCDCTEEHHFGCGMLLYNDKLYLNNHQINLYFLSDDKIEEGDWCYDIYNYRIVKYSHKIAGQYFVKMVNHTKDYEGYSVDRDSLKKVIATTDTSLKKITLEHTQYCIDEEEREAIQKSLLQPSQQFIEKYIEKYNKGNIITEVLVEYEEIRHFGNETIPGWTTNELKINPKDNTITIRKLKESWNREEVIKLLRKLDIENQYSSEEMCEFNLDNWIKENL